MGDRSDWLKGLKAGDTVIVEGGHGSMLLAKVLRTTATQILIQRSYGVERYWIKDGFRVGGDRWTAVILREPTPELMAKRQLAHKRDKARVAWGCWSADMLTEPELDQILAIEEARKARQEGR